MIDKEDLIKLFNKKVINYSKLGKLIYPNLSDNVAGNKLYNKVNGIQNRNMKEQDFKLILDLINNK